ncbi:unnamed protein product, partial [Rotaria sp. Silwood1]
PTDQTVSSKATSAETQKRTIDAVDKSGPQAKKPKNEAPVTGKNVPAGNKNGLKGKGKKQEDDDDDEDDDELDFDEDDDDDDDDDDEEEEEVTLKKPVGKPLATGKQAKPAAKPSAAEDDDE